MLRQEINELIKKGELTTNDPRLLGIRTESIIPKTIRDILSIGPFSALDNEVWAAMTNRQKGDVLPRNEATALGCALGAVLLGPGCVAGTVAAATVTNHVNEFITTMRYGLPHLLNEDEEKQKTREMLLKGLTKF